MKLPFIVQSRPFIGILFLIKRKVYSITIKRHKEKVAYSNWMEEMFMKWVLIIALSAAIYAAVYMMKSSRENSLIQAGKAIKRERAFWEKAEVFATNADYETVVSEISRMDFSEIKAGVYPNVNGERAVLWKSSYAWNAKLTYMGESGGRQVFRFAFPCWKTRNGVPYREDSMNIMMTSVEKLFLSLDSSTTVEAHAMQLNRKMRII